MQVGLRLAKIGYEGQKVVELEHKEHYGRKLVGEGYPDLVVHLGNEKLIVELKAISGELGAGRAAHSVHAHRCPYVPRSRCRLVNAGRRP